MPEVFGILKLVWFRLARLFSKAVIFGILRDCIVLNATFCDSYLAGKTKSQDPNGLSARSLEY